MDPNRILRWLRILSVVLILLIASTFFSYRRLQQRDRLPSPVPAPTVSIPVPSARTPAPVATEPPPPLEESGCREQVEYMKMREELGLVVNKRSLYESFQDFAKAIDTFRSQHGLPFPLQVQAQQLDKENVIFSKCKRACHGGVNQVFVSELVRGKYAKVLLKTGGMTELPLRESGLEVAIVNELNKKGIPFRFWPVPSSEGPWFILGTDLYLELDIPKLSLRVSSNGAWKVVVAPEHLDKLVEVRPFDHAGCHPEEHCYKSSKNRIFSAPKVCAAIMEEQEN